MPEGFAVERDTGSGKLVFLALVDDGNAVLEQGEGDGLGC